MQYNITINAPKEKVWNSLWEDANYRNWTSAFAEGSSAETDWKKGSKVIFGDGKGSGMVSRVEENIPNEYMGIVHVGLLKDGVEDLESEEVKQWAGAYENYTLKEENGKTALHVELGGAEMPQEFLDYFEKTWPIALDRLKKIAEGENNEQG